jgi:hypothetical protein
MKVDPDKYQIARGFVGAVGGPLRRVSQRHRDKPVPGAPPLSEQNEMERATKYSGAWRGH